MRLYHLTFATKFRQPFLQGDVRDAVLESFRLIAREIRVEVLAAEAFSIMPTSSSVSPTTKKLAVVMQRLKGRSSRDIFLKFDDLRDVGSSTAFWQEGYGTRHIFPEQVETVRHYIEDQQSHHGGSA